MTKKQMQQVIVDNLKNYLPRNKQWKIQCVSIAKENGKMADAISVSCDDNVSMLVYIDDIYEQYRHGAPFNKLLTDISNRLSESLPQYVSDASRDAFNFVPVKDRVFASLINTKMNKIMLDGLPHRNIEDLSVVYRILVDSNDEHNATIVINNELLSVWATTENELYELAMKNTERLLPISVRGMIDTLKDSIGLFDDVCFDELVNQDKESMYIISNTQGIRGAIYMFNTKILARVAEKLSTNRLYIFPSSIHEVIVCDFERLSAEEANEMVATINNECVHDEDVLSNHAYLFDKTTMTITSL